MGHFMPYWVANREDAASAAGSLSPFPSCLEDGESVCDTALGLLVPAPTRQLRAGLTVRESVAPATLLRPQASEWTALLQEQCGRFGSG